MKAALPPPALLLLPVRRANAVDAETQRANALASSTCLFPPKTLRSAFRYSTRRWPLSPTYGMSWTSPPIRPPTRLVFYPTATTS